MKKARTVLAVFLFFAVISQMGLAAMEAPPAVENNSNFWRMDAENTLQLPRNFRTSNDKFKYGAAFAPSRKGMDQLHMSGSAQFSERSFVTMLSKLPGKVIVVDLRQESHGLVNGNGVSWYGKHNWANRGKTDAEVYQDEIDRLQQTMGSDITVFTSGTYKQPEGRVSILVDSALTEKEFVKDHQVGYVRIPVTDKLRPSDDNVDEFIRFYKNLPPHIWLHFHCLAGQGRTTTFMTMYDILHNAKKVSLEDIMSRQVLIGGENLLKLKSENTWQARIIRERADFIKDFYEYVRQSPDNLPVPWSEWVKQNKI